MKRPPPRLYKFRTMTSPGNEELLGESKIWLSRISEFNDPYDGNPVYAVPDRGDIWHRVTSARPDASPHEQRMYADQFEKLGREELQQLGARATSQIGAFCLSAAVGSSLQWGHYAAGHRGFCVELDASQPPFDWALEVEYAGVRPTAKITTEDDEAVRELMKRVALTKALDWKYEAEWRLLVPDTFGYQPFDPTRVTSVIFGARMPDDSRVRILEMLARRGPKPMIKVADLSDGYEVTVRAATADELAVLDGRMTAARFAQSCWW